MSDRTRVAIGTTARRAKTRRGTPTAGALLVLLVVAACGGGNPDAPPEPTAPITTIDPVTCNSAGNCR